MSHWSFRAPFLQGRLKLAGPNRCDKAAVEGGGCSSVLLSDGGELHRLALINGMCCRAPVPNPGNSLTFRVPPFPHFNPDQVSKSPGTTSNNLLLTVLVLEPVFNHQTGACKDPVLFPQGQEPGAPPPV